MAGTEAEAEAGTGTEAGTQAQALGCVLPDDRGRTGEGDKERLLPPSGQAKAGRGKHQH